MLSLYTVVVVFGPINILLTDPVVFLVMVVGVLFGLVLHNVVQALVASRFGDPSAQRLGFTSTEPQVHFDPISVLFYFLLGLCSPRNIPVNNRNLNRTGTQEALVWLSGVATLIVFALVLLLVMKLLNNFVPILDTFGKGLYQASYSLVIHAVVFLIPLPMLDGGKALYAVGNASVRQLMHKIMSLGPLAVYVIFLLILFSGWVSALVYPVWSAMQAILGNF